MTTSQGPIVFKTRMPTSCQVYENLLVGDWPILCGREQAFQGPPRISQRIAARGSSTAKKIFSRTPKCHLQRSWARDPEDSKSKPMVRARERRADREPSLVVGRGHISWTMLSLMALTRQKQLAKSRQAASRPASQRQVCLFQDCLFSQEQPFRRGVSIFFVENKKWDREKQLAKMKFCLIGRLRTSSETCLQRMF